MIFLPVCLLLTNHETLYNINIVLSFHPPGDKSLPFLQSMVCDLKTSPFSDK